MKRLLLTAILAGTIATFPNTLAAQDHGTRTYSDAQGEKHEWNANEDAAWKRYRDEHHIKQEEFAKAKRKQQQEYWKWRHDHPDAR